MMGIATSSTASTASDKSSTRQTANSALLSYLGIKKRRCTTTADATGAASVSTTANLLDSLGIEDDIDDDPCHYLHCPCGWKPERGKGRREQPRAQANRHWRKCQGTLAPKTPKGFQTRMLQSRAGEIRSGNTQRSIEAFKTWRKNIVAKKKTLEGGLCTPNFDVPSTIIYRSSSLAAFTCTKCSSMKLLGNFRRHPCATRPKSLSRIKFFELIRGKAYAAYKRKIESSHGGYRKKAKKYATTTQQRCRVPDSTRTRAS